MEIRKCEQCGGNLKRLRTQKTWVCPFCDARYYDEPEEKKEGSEEYFGLNDEVFVVQKDLTKRMKKAGANGVVKTIVHCMETYDTAEEIEKYMLTKLSFSDDISTMKVREDQIKNAMQMIQPVMLPGERVIVYGNKGIFSKGKEYFVITDKRSIFVNNKKVKDVLHTDLDSFTLADCGNCTINSDYDKNIISLDGNGRFQGALLAMMCMIAFEENEDREKIQIF